MNSPGKGGKNRRKGKNAAFEVKRDLTFKEDLQGTLTSRPHWYKLSDKNI